jgi:hypothetical protein
MEYWNIGVLEQWVINSEFADGEVLLPNIPAFHYSIIPIVSNGTDA